MQVDFYVSPRHSFDSEKDLEEWLCKNCGPVFGHTLLSRQARLGDYGVSDVVTYGPPLSGFLDRNYDGPDIQVVWELKNTKARIRAASQVSRYSTALDPKMSNGHMVILAPNFSVNLCFLASQHPRLLLIGFHFGADALCLWECVYDPYSQPEPTTHLVR